MSINPLGTDSGSSVDLWISSETAGEFGLFNVNTGAIVSGIGHTARPAWTDIAFIGNQMYGTTHESLYEINDKTGAYSKLRTYRFTNGMNALVGDGSSLLGASYNSDEVYKIAPSGVVTDYANIPYPSAGDLAFAGRTLYESVL